MYYVYLIETPFPRAERHMGLSTDLKQRLREHNQAKSSHTTKFRPWKLISYVAFTDRAEAELLSVVLDPVQVMHREKAPIVVGYSNFFACWFVEGYKPTRPFKVVI